MTAIRDRVEELRRVRAGDLLPNPKNWRRHPAAQRRAMQGLLNDVGFIGPALARQTPAGLMLLDGHLRAELAEDAVIPVVVLKDDVTDEEADKILLTFDPVADLFEQDNERLAELLASVATQDDAVAALLESIARDARLALPTGAGLTDPDAVPETPKEPTTQPGDLWLLGGHRLACADARSPEAMSDLVMQGGLAACMWTDPPYGVSYEGKTKDALTIENDGATGLGELLHEAFRNAREHLELGAPFYIARPAGPQGAVFLNAIIETFGGFHEELQWVKDSMVLGHSDYHVRHETLVYGWTPGPGRSGRGNHEGSRWYGDHAQTSVFEIPRPKASRDHPTAKPVELVERCLGNSSRPGDIVLDPFLGSGTTLIAAERLGRRCYGLEIDRRYCDVIVRRWEEFTGRKAVLEVEHIGVEH